MQQQHLHRTGTNPFGPDLVLASGDWNHANAGARSGRIRTSAICDDSGLVAACGDCVIAECGDGRSDSSSRVLSGSFGVSYLKDNQGIELLAFAMKAMTSGWSAIWHQSRCVTTEIGVNEDR